MGRSTTRLRSLHYLYAVQRLCLAPAAPLGRGEGGAGGKSVGDVMTGLQRFILWYLFTMHLIDVIDRLVKYQWGG
jgi:hypothetical protein